MNGNFHGSGLGGSEGFVDELDDALAAVEAMPGLGRWAAKDAGGERAVVFAGVGDEFDGDAFLTQGTIHFLGLAQRVGGVAFSLNEQEGGFGVRGSGERALPPGVFHVLPGLAEVPAVVP